tara:strand:- start:917 stop:1699 length:783 start_codon:yes stop_codon:yes gene_type:complete
MKKHVIGACCRLGQKLNGVQYGSSYFALDKVFGHNTTFDYQEFYSYHKKMGSDTNVITIGGDHSISEYTVKSSMKKKDNVHVIWIDAHADINTESTSGSGNSHGMMVSKLLGYDSRPECLKPYNLTYVGLRDIDIPEKSIIELEKIKVYSTQNVLEYGPKHIASEIIASAETEGDAFYHISIDVDVIDPSYFPYTGTPVIDGLRPEYVKELLKIFKNKTIGLDIVEFNPLVKTMGETGERLESCLEIIDSWVSVYTDLEN